MRRRTFCGQAMILVAALQAGGLAADAPVPAQLRVDVEVFHLSSDPLPEQVRAALKRLRRETALSGAEAEKVAEVLRRADGQRVWVAGRFSRETEEGVPIIVRMGRRRQQMPGYGLTLTPSVRTGSIAIEAELRTGKPRPDVCDPLVRSYSLKVPMGGYAAFWLTAQDAEKPDAVVIARFHPSE